MNHIASFEVEQLRSSAPLGSSWDGCPVPSVVLREVLTRPRSTAHIIVFANEKGGVGKSTLALHTAIALSYSGAKVLAVDLDRRQCSLAGTLAGRSGTANALKIDLPGPRHIVLDKQSGAMLDQEISRLGRDVDFVVIDLPGHDTAACRYAIAIADTLVTPVGNSTYDITGLGKINPVSGKMTGAGHFGTLVSELRSERVRSGFEAFDWLVLKNRARGGDQRLEAQTSEALEQMSATMDFRIGAGLPERLGFRDLLSYGLTYLDLRRIPGLGKRRLDVESNIANLVIQLNLPGFESHNPKPKIGKDIRPRMPHLSIVAYEKSLYQHMKKVSDPV